MKTQLVRKPFQTAGYVLAVGCSYEHMIMCKIMRELWAERLDTLADLLGETYTRESLSPIISVLPKT